MGEVGNYWIHDGVDSFTDEAVSFADDMVLLANQSITVLEKYYPNNNYASTTSGVNDIRNAVDDYKVKRANLGLSRAETQGEEREERRERSTIGLIPFCRELWDELSWADISASTWCGVSFS